MNKKFLFSAALIGLVGFASCVDNTESASVTAVRQAKAEQLKAIADLDKANAEAALILANAEKAAKEAQAAYNNAQAELMKAQAAYYNAKTEMEKEAAAVELEKSKVALEQARAELQARLAQLDADVAKYKYDAAKYQQDYEKLLASADKEKAAEIQNLLNNYDSAAKTLIEIKRNIARYTSKLAKLESGLTSIPESIQQSIQDLEEENADKQIEINAQNAIIATYEQYAGKTVTEEEVNDAHLAMVDLQVKRDEAANQYDEDRTAKNAAEQPLYEYQNEIWNNWVNGNKNLSYSLWNDVTERWDYYSVRIEQVWNTSAPATAYRKYCVVVEDQSSYKTTYLPLFEDVESESTTIDYELTNSTGSYSYGTYTSYYNLIDDGKALETLIAHKETMLTQWSNPDYLESLKKQLPELQKAQEDAQKAFNEASKKYDDAVSAEETAQAAYNAAAEKSNAAWDAYYQNTDANKAEELLKAAQDLQKVTDEASQTYNDASNARWNAYNAKQNALNELDNANYALNNCEESINNNEFWAAEYAKQIAELKEEVAALVEMGKANVENVKAYNEAVATEANSYVAYAKARDVYSVQSSEYWEFYNAYNYFGGIVGGNSEANNKIINAQNEIKSLNSQIESNNQSIESYQKDLADIESGNYSKTEMLKEQIANLQAKIEKLNVSLNTAQQKYDIAKAELDAAISAE